MGIDVDFRRQRGSGVFGVYTMHGSSATRLADDDRHSLMHMNHIPAPPDSSQLAMTAPVLDSEGGGGGLSPHGISGGSSIVGGQLSGGRGYNGQGQQAYDEAQALKAACRPCVEIEEMLGLNQAMGKGKKELMHLQTLRLEARKLKRESQALRRHTEQLRELKKAFNRKHRRGLESGT